MIYGTALILLVFDILKYNQLFYKTYGSFTIKNNEKKNYKKVLLYFFGDFLILFLLYLFITHSSLKNFANNNEIQIVFIILTCLWFLSSLLTEKYTTDFSNNFWYLISPQWKSIILLGTGISFFRVIFTSSLLNNQQVIQLLSLFFSLEVLVTGLYFIIFNVPKKVDLPDEDLHFGSMVEDVGDQDKMSNNTIESLTEFVETQKNNTLTTFQELIDFIAKIPKLKDIKINQTITYDTEHIFNIEELRKHSLHLLINLHTVNDFPLINKYFLTVYSRLVPGGYFVSKVRTIENHRKRFFQKYPKFISHFFYIIHYTFYRIFPYTPILDKLFLLLTHGKRTVIAKAEILGRLYYSGFRVISTHEIGDYLYFVSQKSNIPALQEIPSAHLLIKLKRVGMNGKIFDLYKFRTMYPYSEFLQEYIYDLNKLKDSGKIQDDFRITGWGRILRKFWLDELPQIINYIKGDIGLVGVRALSFHYFNLYPPELRKLRTKYKNGILPPFYADMPKTFDEIIDSEKTIFHTERTTTI